MMQLFIKTQYSYNVLAKYIVGYANLSGINIRFND